MGVVEPLLGWDILYPSLLQAKDSWLTGQSLGDTSFTELLSFMSCCIATSVTKVCLERHACGSGSSQVSQDPGFQDCHIQRNGDAGQAGSHCL